MVKTIHRFRLQDSRLVKLSNEFVSSQKISRKISELDCDSKKPLPNVPGFSKLPSMVRQTALFVAMLQ